VRREPRPQRHLPPAAGPAAAAAAAAPVARYGAGAGRGRRGGAAARGRGRAAGELCGGHWSGRQQQGQEWSLAAKVSLMAHAESHGRDGKSLQVWLASSGHGQGREVKPTRQALDRALEHKGEYLEMARLMQGLPHASFELVPLPVCPRCGPGQLAMPRNGACFRCSACQGTVGAVQHLRGLAG